MRYNQNQYNTGLWGGDGATIGPTYPTDLVVFDGFSLSDNTYMICQNLIDSAATREVLTGNVPRGNGLYVNGDYWRKKPIEVRGHIRAASREALDAYLDNIRKNLRKRERDLDVTRTGAAGVVTSVRRYTATWINPEEIFAAREGHHITLCPFNAKFECAYPFGRSRDYVSESFTLTSSPTNHSVYHAGTIEADPVVTMIFDAASSVTVVNVQRIDPATGETLEEIEHSGSIAAHDVLAFDSESQTVTKNGTEVNYTGSFPALPPGGSLLKFTVTASSFSAYTTVKHRSTYL